LIIRLKMCF